MRYSKALIPTLKESPADAEAISHKLMVRAGLIRKLTSGAYSYLPLGNKVLNKVISIVREEMDSAGAQEILMPALHPAELWHETGRYEVMGDELVKFKDRTGREMVIGPTHEEVVTDIARREIHSYKDLPQILYQIQTKLRDEPRPRFGIIRSKEFIMKDAYSFHKDESSLDESYKNMFDTYHRIFKRCGLEVITVEADVGMMGGSESAEFMVLSESGEDMVVVCKCGYRTSLAIAKCKSDMNAPAKSKTSKMKEVSTPGVSSIEKVSEFLKVSPERMIKTLIYVADDEPVAVVLRGDHDVNDTKLANVLKVSNLELADEVTIKKVTGGPLGFSGPCGLKAIKIIVDNDLLSVEDGVAGANKKDTHLINVLPGRDFDTSKTYDIRYITEKDSCPECGGSVELKRSMEVGHVFKLGTKYSHSMKALFLDSNGSQKEIIMGCYGIGINRIIAAAIEQSNDKDGIIWPESIAPYKVALLSVGKTDEKVSSACEKLYKELQDAGIEVLYDEREMSPGIKFKDADLIGIPYQLVIGAKSLAKGIAEIKNRKTGERKEVSLDSVVSFLR
ncbi:MAG: proline--tRNA ligase [Candidatus Omnitrophota bacterium]